MRLLPKQLSTVFARLEYLLKTRDGAISEEDDPFKDLQDEIDALRTVQSDLIPEDINAPSLVVDAEVSAVQPRPTDAEILADFLETDNISDELVDDSDDVEDVPMECPGKKMSSYMHWSFSKSSLCLQLMVILFSPIASS